jgi:L-iditol 2-dehydrogenase
MKAAVYYDIDDLRCEERPIPSIKPGEVLVKVKVCGLCGTDLSKIVNKSADRGTVLGHEVVGEIQEVGKEVKKFKKGERVFFAHHVPCFICHYCQRGHHTLCKQFKETNIEPGGFTEHVRVPRLNVEKTMFSLPEAISYEEASLIEPIATVLRSLGKCNPQPTDAVVVIGAGPIGILHIQLLKRVFGSGEVIAVDLIDKRLTGAREFGADEVVNPQKEDLPEKVKKVTEGKGVDLVIVAVGNVDALEEGIKVVRKGGKVEFFAECPPNSSLTLDPNLIYHSEVTLLGSYSSTPLEQRMALELLRLRKIEIKKLVTHRFPLEKISEAVKLAQEAKDCLKILIIP